MLVFGIAQFWYLSYDLAPNYDVGPRCERNRRKKLDFNEFSFWAPDLAPNYDVSLWNRSILMLELGFRPKLRFWANMSTKQTQKIGFQRIQLISSRTLRNGKLNMSVFGIAQFWYLSNDLGPNYDFGSRCAQNRRKKSDFNEFGFWAPEPLRNCKKTCQAFESLNSYVQAMI